MNSEKVLSFFKEITTVPRESGHEEHIIAYLQDFAAARSLECKTDDAGNVLIVKEAAPGYEDVPAIVLQSHSDMVCEKNEGVDHDFAKDPIRYVIENGWMIAPDTTLGADCGIGIAAQLALLDSDLPCGKIECLFTTSEETGLDGAMALQPGFFQQKFRQPLIHALPHDLLHKPHQLGEIAAEEIPGIICHRIAKSCSVSTLPFSGTKSRTCPTDAITRHPRPRYFSIVFAFDGDSTISKFISVPFCR